MRKINLDRVKVRDLKSSEDLFAHYKKVLVKKLGVRESQAEAFSKDILNIIGNPRISHVYVKTMYLGSILYSVYLCSATHKDIHKENLAINSFEFYMLIDLNTLKEQTADGYKSARKVFLFS